jgi:hypothetical protein
MRGSVCEMRRTMDVDVFILIKNIVDIDFLSKKNIKDATVTPLLPFIDLNAIHRFKRASTI